MTTRRRRTSTTKRKTKGRRDSTALAAIAAAVLALTAITYARHHPAVTILAAVGLGLVGVGVSWTKARRRHVRIAGRRTIAGMQRLNPAQFEHAIADLCRRDGCRDVRVVGGAGDLAADVLATTPDGRRIMIQAKRYAPSNPVRSPALQAVNGTYRQVHGAHLAAVVTTSRFTPQAAAFGRQVGLRLLDAQALAEWAAQTGPPPWN